MKNKFITMALASLAFTACTNDDAISLDKELQTNNQNKVVLMAEDDAQQAFAKILSKAVYNDISVREFIKSEAIKQFDNDYDILYAFAKDKEVAPGYTFRDALLNYCKDENELISIEQSLPLLNILVPDLTFISSFKADNWDLSDEEVPVSYDKDHNSGVLFVNGDSITYLEPNEIPDFPILVVKNNERMIASATTRADGTTSYSYEFFDDAFNGSLRNNTRAEYDVTYPEEPTGDSQISEYELASINPAIKQAFTLEPAFSSLTILSLFFFPIRKLSSKILFIKLALSSDIFNFLDNSLINSLLFIIHLSFRISLNFISILEYISHTK